MSDSDTMVKSTVEQMDKTEFVAHLIDKAVRAARADGWCTEFERVMESIFPDGPPDGAAEFVDSDGMSCRGFDRDGYSSDGYNRDGYDRDGYDRDGFDENGRNRDGFDIRGFHVDGRHQDHPELPAEEVSERFKFNSSGWTLDGYDLMGYNTAGFDRSGRDRQGRTVAEVLAASPSTRRRYRYDADGFDPRGSAANGYSSLSPGGTGSTSGW